jgi:DNA-directed RNA polymerase omega subunit
MARVSVQDCLLHVSSPFDLAMIAAKRARQLARGAEAKLPWDGHKSTVLALKRAATGTGVTFTVWQPVGGSNVWLRAHRETLTPSDREPIPSLAPEGDRSGWQLSLGLRL